MASRTPFCRALTVCRTGQNRPWQQPKKEDRSNPSKIFLQAGLSPLCLTFSTSLPLSSTPAGSLQQVRLMVPSGGPCHPSGAPQLGLGAAIGSQAHLSDTFCQASQEMWGGRTCRPGAREPPQMRLQWGFVGTPSDRLLANCGLIQEAG